MALLQDLIQQIDDPALRERILQETNKLLKQKSLDWCLKSIFLNVHRFTMCRFVSVLKSL